MFKTDCLLLYLTLIGLGFCILLPLGAELTKYFAYYRRKRRFSKRPVCSFDDWYSHFYGFKGPNKEFTCQVCREIAEEIGVEPTQIYPTDRIEEEFKYREWWAYQGDEIEALFKRVDRFLQVRQAKAPEDFAPKTVEELILGIESLLANRQTKE